MTQLQSLPNSFFLCVCVCVCVYCIPAMGVLHDPSSAVRKARSHTTAMRVSSWLRPARYLAAAVSSVRHAIPMAPYVYTHTHIHTRISTQCVVTSMHHSLPALCMKPPDTTTVKILAS